jgi:hypothetical protein
MPHCSLKRKRSNQSPTNYKTVSVARPFGIKVKSQTTLARFQPNGRKTLILFALSIEESARANLPRRAKGWVPKNSGRARSLSHFRNPKFLSARILFFQTEFGKLVFRDAEISKMRQIALHGLKPAVGG